MAVDHRITRTSENFKGLDLRSSDIVRGQDFATDMRNAAYRISGAINKRKGFTNKASTGHIKGMTTFKNISNNGAVTDELIYVEDDTIKKEVNFNLVAYRPQSISTAPITMSINNNTIQATDGTGASYYNKTFTNANSIAAFFKHWKYRTTFATNTPIIDWDSLDPDTTRLHWDKYDDSIRDLDNSLDMIYIFIPVSAIDIPALEEYLTGGAFEAETNIYNNDNYSDHENDLFKFMGINILKNTNIGTSNYNSMSWVDVTSQDVDGQINSYTTLSTSTGATHLRMNINMYSDNINSEGTGMYLSDRTWRGIAEDLNFNLGYDWNNFAVVFAFAVADFTIEKQDFDIQGYPTPGGPIEKNSTFFSISLTNFRLNFLTNAVTYSGQTDTFDNLYTLPSIPGTAEEFIANYNLSDMFSCGASTSIVNLELRNNSNAQVNNFETELVSSLQTTTTEITNNSVSLYPTIITVGNVEEQLGSLTWSPNIYQDINTENVNFASINNILYISNGVDDVLKYDGDKIYRAGLPNAKEDEFTLTAENISVNNKTAIFTATPGFVEEIGTDLGVADAEVFLMPNHKYIFHFNKKTQSMRTYVEVDTLPSIQTDTYIENGTTYTVAINVHPYQIYFAKDTQTYNQVNTSNWTWNTTSVQYKIVNLPDYKLWKFSLDTPGSKSLSGTGLRTYLETDSESGVKSMGVHSYIDSNGDRQYYGGSGYTGYDEVSEIYSNYVDIRMGAIIGDNSYSGGTYTQRFYKYQSYLYDGTLTAYLYSASQIAGRITIQSATPLETKKTYEYLLQYEYTDNKGNIISSQQTNPIKLEVSGEENVKITFSSFDDLTSSFDLQGEFDSDWKTSNGVSNDIIPTVQPTTSTTNPLTGNNYTQQELDLLKVQGQKRMRVLVYRSKGYFPSNGEVVGLYYKVADVEYDGTSTTHYDTIEDDKLNPFVIFVDAVKRKDPPPKGKYLTVFKNCLVISGQKENVNNISYSLPKNFITGEIGSEYFPDDDNSIVVESSFGSKITAISALKDLMFVFHRDSIFAVSGNINQLELPTVDLITKEGGVGCTSQASIEEFNGGLAFVSDTGVYTVSNKGLQELSDLIKPLFLDKNFAKEKAISFNWTDKNLLLICIPNYVVIGDVDYNLADDTADAYVHKDSLILAYDYFKQAWLRWDTLEFTDGITSIDNKVNFARATNVGNFKAVISDNGTAGDYNDNGQPINFIYETNWESLGDPTVPKKFLRLKVHSFNTDQTFESNGFLLEAGIQKNYYNVNDGKIDFDFAETADGGWGNFRWGDSNWGSLPSTFLKSKLPTGKATSLKIRFANQEIDENILITNYELEIAAPYKQEIK